MPFLDDTTAENTLSASEGAAALAFKEMQPRLAAQWSHRCNPSGVMVARCGDWLLFGSVEQDRFTDVVAGLNLEGPTLPS